MEFRAATSYCFLGAKKHQLLETRPHFQPLAQHVLDLANMRELGRPVNRFWAVMGLKFVKEVHDLNVLSGFEIALRCSCPPISVILATLLASKLGSTMQVHLLIYGYHDATGPSPLGSRYWR